MIIPFLLVLLVTPPLLHVATGIPRQAPTNSPAKPSPGCGKCSEPTWKEAASGKTF